jgi:hypothetical protein
MHGPSPKRLDVYYQQLSQSETNKRFIWIGWNGVVIAQYQTKDHLWPMAPLQWYARKSFAYLFGFNNWRLGDLSVGI